MGRCRRSYILLVRKFRTSEMLDKWSPTSKLCNIKFFHYPDCRYIFFTCTRTHLSTIPIKPFLISSNLFPCLLWLNFEYWLCIVFTTFLRTGILHDFTWIFIDWVSAGFLTDVFSPWPKKKRHRKKSQQKMFLQTQSKISVHILFKGKCNFCHLDNSFRKIKLFV